MVGTGARTTAASEETGGEAKKKKAVGRSRDNGTSRQEVASKLNSERAQRKKDLAKITAIQEGDEEGDYEGGYEDNDDEDLPELTITL